MIKILHNAFEVYDLPSIFDSDGTVRVIAGAAFTGLFDYILIMPSVKKTSKQIII